MFTKEDSHSFLLYPEQINKARKKLTNEQFGLLFGALLDYATDEIIYDDEPIVSAYFDLISHTLELDNRKYKARVDYRKENGKKGGRPPKKPKPIDEPIKQKPPKQDKDALDTAYNLINKRLLDKIVTNAYDEIGKLSEDDQEIMSDLISDCSDKLDVSIREHLEAGYKTFRNHCKKKENIYSTESGKSKREPDALTEAVHGRALSRKDLESINDDYMPNDESVHNKIKMSVANKALIINGEEVVYKKLDDTFYIYGGTKSPSLNDFDIMNEIYFERFEYV